MILHMKETKQNRQRRLRCINYDQHKRQVGGYLKFFLSAWGIYQVGVSSFEMGQMTKKYLMYQQKRSTTTITGTCQEIQSTSIISGVKNILLYYIYILKLDILKKIVNALNKRKAAFKYLQNRFPRFSEAKIKESIFVGLHIRKLLLDENFDRLFCGKETRL